MKTICFRRLSVEVALREYEDWLNKEEIKEIHFVDMVNYEEKFHIIVTYE